MRGTAEQVRTSHLPPADVQLVFVVPELMHDAEVRQKAASFIGAVATGAWQEDISAREMMTVKPIESLHAAIHLAAEGDETALKMVETNVATDVIERTLKAGHITKVDLMADEAGTIQQHGQSLESVQANSLRFASGNWQMRQRTEAETRNAFRIKQYRDLGVLKDYYFVVFSRAADNMTTKQMEKAGFFTETMSCAIQLTSDEGERLVTESAFVAGKLDRDAERHDKDTIHELCEILGIDIGDIDATELLDTPLLIHKSRLPNGVVDMVELYDFAKGDTFFGQAKPKQDYLAYRKQCEAREAGFQPKVQAIMAELIAEAPTITSPIMAVERLHKLSGKHMVELAVEDLSINPAVFGASSANHIEMARWHAARGNHELAHQETKEAVRKDRSSSCPTALTGKSNTGSENETSENERDGSSSEDSNEDCEFVSKECPECGAKNVKTVVKKISGSHKRISGDCGCSKTYKD